MKTFLLETGTQKRAKKKKEDDDNDDENEEIEEKDDNDDEGLVVEDPINDVLLAVWCGAIVAQKKAM